MALDIKLHRLIYIQQLPVCLQLDASPNPPPAQALTLYLVWDSEAIEESEDRVLTQIFESVDQDSDDESSDHGKKGGKKKASSKKNRKRSNSGATRGSKSASSGSSSDEKADAMKFYQHELVLIIVPIRYDAHNIISYTPVGIKKSCVTSHLKPFFNELVLEHWSIDHACN